MQQASRELAIHSYELNYFEDSFTLQLAQIQQHVRTTRQRREGPIRAALVERAQTMLRISRMLDRTIQRLGEQAQSLNRMTEEARQLAPFQPEPQAN